MLLAYYGVVAAGTAYAGYQVYQAYHDGGVVGACQQLGIEVTAAVVGAGAGKVVYTVGSKAYPSLKLALNAVFERSPELRIVLGSLTNTLVEATSKASAKVASSTVGSTISQATARAEARLLNFQQQAAKRFQIISREKVLAHQSEPWQSKYWSIPKDYTFKGQTNKVYQRNDLIDPNLCDAKGRTNIQRMKDGLAPWGPDGKEINLHHTIQRHNGPVAEVTETFHQQHTRIIHINDKKIPSGINRPEFNKWKRQYWAERAKDFEKK